MPRPLPAFPPWPAELDAAAVAVPPDEIEGRCKEVRRGLERNRCHKEKGR